MATAEVEIEMRPRTPLDDHDPQSPQEDGSENENGSDESKNSEDYTDINGNMSNAEAVYKCNMCEYGTSSHLSFQTHLKTHTAESRKVFRCDVCNMKFSNGANMRRHRVRHTGVKPFECKICQKRFFRKDHLAEHLTTHSKRLPFHCPVCNKGFQRQIAMRAHFQNEHVGHSDGGKTCGLCRYQASSLQKLSVHMSKQHGIDLDSPVPSRSTTNGSSVLANALHSSPDVSMYSGASSEAVARVLMDPSSVSLVPHHFLAPHVEISVASPSVPVCSENVYTDASSRPADQSGQGSPTTSSHMLNGASPEQYLSSPESNVAASSTNNETDIQPDISLIPIKQEVGDDSASNADSNDQECSSGQVDSDSCVNGEAVKVQNECQSGTSSPINLSSSGPNGKLLSPVSSTPVSLIKVSPLKSLLKEEPRRVSSSTTSHVVSSSYLGLPAASTSTSAAFTKLANNQCLFCGIMFPDQTLYFLHKGFHCESNPWKCNICGDVCQDVYDFNSHLLSKAHQ